MIRGRRAVEELRRQYERDEQVGDDAAAVAVLREVVGRFPRAAWAWFDLGLRHKWAHEWDAARDCNQRALDLARRKKGEPAAWNLGIAATALGDWNLARTAWRVFGIEIAAGVGPINADLGPTPVRLNPEPQHPGQLPVVVDGAERETEVVWGRRLCPARVRIENVPHPGSGHRFGDVVLLDGTPDGTRTFAGQEWPVFDEIGVLERSPYPTLTTELTVSGPDDMEAAEVVFVDEGFGFECWPEHDQERSPDDVGGPVNVGIAADVESAERLLTVWRAAGAGRGFAQIVLARP